MEIRIWAERLAQADRLFAHGEALCLRQAALLRRCWVQGWDIAEAEALLVQPELSLTLKGCTGPSSEASLRSCSCPVLASDHGSVSGVSGAETRPFGMGKQR